MSDTQPKEFGKFRATFWPVRSYELKKFLPLTALLFFILFVYTIVRDLKDTFLNTKTNMWVGADPKATADLISCIKLWFVLPFAFLAVIVFGWLVGKFGSKKTFYIIISFFMGFYTLFGFVFYPNLETLKMPSEQITSMIAGKPVFIQQFLTCFANWPITLFYVFAELWGAMAIASLFWQFVNAIVKKSETKRFYATFSMIANIGVIIAGFIIQGVAGKDISIFTVMILMGIVATCCIIVLSIYTYIHKVILTDPRFYDPSQVKPKKKKAKVSALEGIKILFTNKYMLLIAVLVLGYGIVINLAETVMKAEFKALSLVTGKNYAYYQSWVSIVTGILTVVFAIIANYVLRRFSWKFAALITPVLMGIFCTAFFALSYLNHIGVSSIIGFSTLFLAAVFGIFQDAVSKSIKYCLFDTTKNMAYIPLDEEVKTKGQAAVEVIAARAGKSGGAVIQQGLFTFVTPGAMNNIFSFVAISAVVFVAWILSVFKLNPMYEKALADRAEAEAEAKKVEVAE